MKKFSEVYNNPNNKEQQKRRRPMKRKGVKDKMKKWNYAVSSADDAPMTAPILLKGSICDNLEKAAELGYQAIEVHTRPDEEFDYEAIRKAEAKYGCKVGMIITGRLNTEGMCSLIDDRPYVVDAAMAGMKEYIHIAQRMKADLVIGWIKGNIPAGGSREKYISRLAKNLRILADYAKERKVKLNLEVINRYEVNIFTTADEIMTFLEKYKIDNLYVHLDTFHMGIDECDPVEAIRRCRGKIGYFHLADNSRRYPGTGQFDFAKILEALEEVGYDGYLSVECLPWPTELEAAKRAIRYMRQVEFEGERKISA